MAEKDNEGFNIEFRGRQAHGCADKRSTKVYGGYRRRFFYHKLAAASAQRAGIRETIITTGPFADVLSGYVGSLKVKMDIKFIANPDYENTNYIYSIDCASDFLHDEIIPAPRRSGA